METKESVLAELGAAKLRVAESENRESLIKLTILGLQATKLYLVDWEASSRSTDSVRSIPLLETHDTNPG